MDAEDVTPVSPPDDEEEEGLGGRFYLRLAGIVALIGIVAWIGLLIFWRALYAWGLFGALLVLAAGLLIWAWFYDRRHPHPKL
jgi:uncharacterized membrane protein YedE/YeeE